MKRLLLMRHGKSDWTSDVATDFERPLTGRGVKSAGKIGNWIMKKGLCPDNIVSSPALRAKSTAHLVCNAMRQSGNGIIYDERIYDADVDDLLTVIKDHAGSDSVMLVGHNPGLDNVLGYLANEKPGRDKKGKLMTTAAVAVLDFTDPAHVTYKGCAELKKLVRPKDL